MALKTATPSAYAALRQRLEDAVSTDCELKTKTAAKKAVDSVLNNLHAILEENVTTDGFNFRTPLGVFKSRLYGSKASRNPQTGEPVTVPPTYKIVLQITKSLKKAK